MTRYLVRKCPRPGCGNILRITQVDGKITEVLGGKQWTIGKKWGRSNWVTAGEHSQKSVRCTAQTRQRISGLSNCWQSMWVSSFEEIKV